MISIAISVLKSIVGGGGSPSGNLLTTVDGTYLTTVDGVYLEYL